MGRERNAAVCTGDDVDEFPEPVHVFASATRRERVMDDLIYVVPRPVVRIKEGLNMAQLAFDPVHMCSIRILKITILWLNHLVSVSVRVHVPVSRPKLITIVSGSIQSLITITNVSTVLS